MSEKNYYSIDPEGKLMCRKCGVPLEKGKVKFAYLDNGFPVYVPEELALGKVLSVEKALEDK